MFSRCLAFCLICLTGIHSLAQQKLVDSLNAELIKHPGEDTFRLNALNGLIRAQGDIDFDKGIVIADEAIALAKKLQNNIKLGLAYITKGALYHGQRDYQKLIDYGELALASYQKAGYKPGLARVYWAMNVGYNALGNYDKANILAQQSLEIYRQLGDVVKQANALNSLGANYYNLGNYPVALEYYLGALKIYEEKKDSFNIAIAVTNAGMVNKYLGRYSKALEYYDRGLNIYRQKEETEKEAQTLNMIGAVYDDSGNLRKALEYYNKSFVINKREDYTWGLASDYSNMGITYIYLSEYDSAIHNLQKGMELIKTMNDEKNEAGMLGYLGLAIARAPDAVLVKYHIPVSSRLTIAESYLKNALKIKQEIKQMQGEMVCWEGLAEVYKKQKNYVAALEATEKLSEIKDSMFSAKNSIAIARSEMQFEQNKKDAVLSAEHAAEIRHQQTVRNFLLAGTVLILLVAGLLFFSYKRRRDAIAKKNDAELKAQITETELKVMRLQMNPHFIFNSLNSISDYITKNNPKEADEYLGKFAKVMRMTLEHSEQQAIPLADDLKALELYMQLEAKRLNNKFTYQVNVSDDIDKENTLVPPMIFQPFVENSIWHGISKKEGQGNILVDIRKEGDMLNCRIDDDGVGRKQAETIKEANEDKKQSLGMRITKARIEILNKLKGSNATVQLVDKPQGVTAELKLPADTNF